MSDLKKVRLQELASVSERLREALALGDDPIARDSAILRFELAFEVSWKSIQLFAQEQGFVVQSPRQSFEQAFRLGWITDELLWKEMLTARNMAVHVYRETLAQALHTKLPAFLAGFVELQSKLNSLS